DVIYSELSQVACEDYNLLITLSQLSSQGTQTIGTAQVPLDKNLLGFHYYDLDINLDEFDFGTSGRLVLSETLSRGRDLDLYVTVESTISNCIVDGNLFKGIYAHELLTAGLEIDSEDLDLMFNGEKADTPYIATPQNNIILTRDGIANYVFDSSSLLYEFDFIIDSIRTDSVTLYENVHYLFDPNQKIITLIGDYNDYSSNLYADITFKAFEWNTGRISSLEPITLTFEKDYLTDITKYLEFVIKYNEIPGYEMEKIDFISGRTILSDEQKSPSLLNIYLYNFVDDIYDIVDFVVYDDYSGTNTFSYVVDRNFIAFEQYFSKTESGSDEFQLKAVFTIEENVGESFISTIGFDIASIDSNIYYNTPNTDHTTNPEVEFDIDLTDYYTNPEIYLEQISVDLD
ncbi:hypothetical protein LCGC14_2834730, partial [marine sediment metagenome]